MIKVFNDISGEMEEFKSIEPNKVRMYVCGPTVYDSPHLGHARSAVAFDMIRKYLEFKGYEVNFVMNYTDVDDKMIDRANDREITIFELAEKYINEYEAMQNALNIADPSVKPRATQEIEAIIAIIKTLEEKGYTYSSSGSVYFDTSKYDGYSYLFRKNQKKEEEDENNEATEDFSQSGFLEEKRNTADFVLWKKRKPHEPYWESPWGKGRPGWHIECSAMSNKYLGKTLDIHGGGKDLKRPHHQNEIAQSECANDATFVNYWIHNGFLNIDEVKMSKSLGNFIVLNDLLKDYSGVLLRYYFLGSYYQRPMNFQTDKLGEAKLSLAKLQKFYSQVKEYQNISSTDNILNEIQAEIKNFFDAMDLDFNTAMAIGYLFSLINLVNKKINTNQPLSQHEQTTLVKFLEDIDTFLNIITPKYQPSQGSDVWKQRFDNVVDKILNLRKKMKVEKNYALADQLRDLVKELGIIVDDKGNDFTWEYDPEILF